MSENDGRGYFPPLRARAIIGYGSLGESLGCVTRWAFFPPSIAPEFTGLVEPGWGWDRQRRLEAAASVPLAAHAVHGWQVVGGVTAARLMAAGRPLTRYGRDRGIEVTPAGRAALAEHRERQRVAAWEAEGFTHDRRSTCPRGI